MAGGGGEPGVEVGARVGIGGVAVMRRLVGHVPADVAVAQARAGGDVLVVEVGEVAELIGEAVEANLELVGIAGDELGFDLAFAVGVGIGDAAADERDEREADDDRKRRCARARRRSERVRDQRDEEPEDDQERDDEARRGNRGHGARVRKSRAAGGAARSRAVGAASVAKSVSSG